MMDYEQKFPCACCRYLTRSSGEPGTFEICPICYWEEDRLQEEQPTLSGGSNQVSLEKGRTNFLAFGACEQSFQEFCRGPNQSEMTIIRKKIDY